MAKKLVEGIEEELTCAVCLDRFADPKVLPCLHTYCKGCVESLVAKSREKNAVVCPKCRERYALPPGGVSAFLSNFTLKNLLELLEVHETTGPGDRESAKALRCENGVDEEVAVARCLVCNVYLCDSCWKLHGKMAASRNHETVSLEAIKKGGEKKLHKPQFCLVHENEVLKLYCKTCSKAICGDCTYIDHKDHKFAFIKDVGQELRQTLERSIEGLRKKEKQFQEYLECLHRAQAEQGANAQACRLEVNRAFDSFIQRIQLCRDRVLQEITKTEKADKKRLSAEADATEISLAKVSSNLSFIDRLLKSGSDTEVASMAAPTLERVKTVEGMMCQRKPAIITGTLNAQDYKAVGQEIDKDFGEHVVEIENNLVSVCNPKGLVPANIVIKGIEELSCGPSTLVINLANPQKCRGPFKPQVKVTQGTTDIPSTVKSTSETSWTVSFLIRKPGQTTITVSINGIMAPGAPFFCNVAFKKLPVGARVQRGPDWTYQEQDRGGLGTVVLLLFKSENYVSVNWDYGYTDNYIWGKVRSGEYKYSLQRVY